MNKLGKVALLLLLCATTVGGFLWLPPAVGFPNPELARIFVFHTPCAMVGYLSAASALWFAIRYLWKRNLEDDLKSRAAFALGLVFWVLTTVTGSIFAKVEWGTYWNWDPRETTILMLMLVNIAYFALRAVIPDPNKQATIGAVYALFAVIALPYLSYILPNATVNTLHPKNVINTRDGLSLGYKLVFWGQTLGLCLVYIWAFRLQVALETLERRFLMRTRRQPLAAVPRIVTRTEN